MIRLEGVNKYFNRFKRNQIHVINNTSLTLDGPELVALLGPSGCGKTTLLNVIGGLDNVQGGKVFIDDERLTGRMTFKKDAIRNLKVGYIFQNYNLVDNKTVFENVALVLRMQGMKDPEEIKEKVHYALEMVGMYRYRNRYADMLSGGERQRVGIARALAKNPQIIIADEPTGNLDSKNTIEVMNIIKTISEKKLVILVTHEEKLADFFASRIIRLKDGQVVSDEPNDHVKDLDYRIDNDIYLKDLKSHKVIEEAGYKINIYDAGDSDITLDIVIKNGNIYFQTKDYLSRLEIVDENSSVELIDAHYEGISKNEHLKQGFDMDKFIPKKKPKHSSILNSFTMLKNGFTQVMNYPILKKILLFGFFFSAMFIVYAMANVAGVVNLPDERFITTNKEYVIVKQKKVDIETFNGLEANPQVAYAIPGDSKIVFSMKYNDFMQTSLSQGVAAGAMTDVALLTEKDLKAGALPTTPYELVVDKMTLEKNIKEGNAKSAGFFKPEDFIGQEIELPNMPKFKIVGITDKHQPNIYVDRSQFINILSQIDQVDEFTGGPSESATVPMVSTDLAQAKGELTLKSGRWPENDYEVMVNYNKREEMPLNKEISTKVNGVKLRTVGYFWDERDRDIKVVSPATMRYKVITKKSDVTLKPVDGSEAGKTALVSTLKDENKSAYDTYAKAKKEYKNKNDENFTTALVMAGVILVISLIEIFLIIRASFLSRIKEIGVYRAIGVKRLDIYRMFMGEIIAITTFASIPGMAFMAYIVKQLVDNVSFFQYSLFMNWLVVAISLGIIYAGNILFGLLPVWRVVSKTPAAILSRTDVD